MLWVNGRVCVVRCVSYRALRLWCLSTIKVLFLSFHSQWTIFVISPTNVLNEQKLYRCHVTLLPAPHVASGLLHVAAQIGGVSSSRFLFRSLGVRFKRCLLHPRKHELVSRVNKIHLRVSKTRSMGIRYIMPTNNRFESNTKHLGHSFVRNS